MKWLLQIAAFLATGSRLLRCFNVDVKSPFVFQGPNNSLFGFSLGLVKHTSSKWFYVGAPTGDMKFPNHPDAANEGAVFLCNASRPGSCENLLLNYSNTGSGKSQMFGFSMSVESEQNGSVLVCSPSWKERGASQPNIFGKCFRGSLGTNLTRPVELHPYRNQRRKMNKYSGKRYIWYHGPQLGFSSHILPDGDGVMLGAPGIFEWKGDVVIFSGTGSNESLKTFYSSPNDAFSGYAVGIGKFFNSSRYDYIVGAPRYKDLGKVHIVDKNFLLSWETDGENLNQLGSYFGAVVAAVDLTGDGRDDLLVGSPMYTTHSSTEGVVYFYSSQSERTLEMRFRSQLKGHGLSNARFGMAIADIGDINNDGFKDIAIGAPFENNNIGSVYIFNGSPTGPGETHSQRIEGHEIDPSLQSFGWAISESLDVDDNGFTDFAVSACLSNKAFILRTRPIVEIETSIVIAPDVIPINEINATCLSVQVYFRYQGGSSSSSTIRIDFTLKSDAEMEHNDKVRVVFVNETERDRTLRGSLELSKAVWAVLEYDAILLPKTKNFIKSIRFEVEYSLQPRDSGRLTLLPFLKGGTSKKLTKMVPFEKECGDNDTCIADLSLSLEVTTPNPSPYLILGRTQHVRLLVRANVSGDDAFNTVVRVNASEVARYIKVEELTNATTAVSCLNAGEQLKCFAGNPAPANSLIKFILLYEVERENLDDGDAFVTITGEIDTDSADPDLVNNIADATVPFMLKAEPELRVQQISSTFSYKKTRPLTLQGSAIFVLVLNVSLHNTGPSFLPATTVRFLIPSALPDGNLLFLGEDIEGSIRGTGDFCSVVNPDAGSTTSGAKEQNLSSVTWSSLAETDNATQEPASKLLTVSCENAECLHIDCPTPKLMLYEYADLSLQLNFTNSEKALTSVDYLQLAAEIIVLLPNHSLMLPWKETKSITLYRSLVADKMPGRRIKYTWVSVASSAVALSLITILGYCFWKCNCCKRKKHEAVMNWRRESRRRTNHYKNRGTKGHLNETVRLTSM